MSENKSFDELLLPVRNDIDRIDKELLKLFTERMQCAERVAEIKRKAGIPVLNAAREQVILDRVKKEAGEYGDSAVALYSAIKPSTGCGSPSAWRGLSLCVRLTPRSLSTASP